MVALSLAAVSGHAEQLRPFPAPKPSLPRPRVDPAPLPLFPVQTLWTITLNNLLTAPPAFDSRHAFFPIEGERIVAYDLASGAQLWITSVRTAVKPVVGGDLLFVVEADMIDALRVADGSTAWLLPFADPLAVPLAWDNGWLIAVTIDGSVRAYRASDGYMVWRRDIGSPAHAPPAIAADRVYVPTENGRVVSLRVDTGEVVWDHRLGGAPSDILALEDRLYVGSKDNFFYCLDTEDGNTKWAVRTGADVIGLPVVDEHRVYFVSLDNILRALNRNTGNQQWKRALTIRPTAGPVQAGETVMVTGLAPTLPAYRAVDGVLAGDLAGGAEVAAVPYIANLPEVFGPVVVVVTRDIAKGATVTAVARSIEPRILAAVLALPGPVTLMPPATEPTIGDSVAPLPNLEAITPPAAPPAP